MASSVTFEILSVTLDALRRRGLIGEDDIEYILAVTEQGVTKAVGSAGHQTVVQMIANEFILARTFGREIALNAFPAGLGNNGLVLEIARNFTPSVIPVAIRSH